jgi:transcriptional regulator with XRE-family HTH domain
METQKITSELLATGLTQQELADLIDCSQSTVAAFLNGTRGSNPTYAIATRLLELHTERCSPTSAAPPTPARPDRQQPEVPS